MKGYNKICNIVSSVLLVREHESKHITRVKRQANNRRRRRERVREKKKKGGGRGGIYKEKGKYPARQETFVYKF